MRKLTFLLFAASLGAFLFAAIPLFAGNPAAAIGSARTAINEHRYADAVKVLQDAIPDATQIADEKQRSMALGALHFYSALAFSGMNNEAKAKEELEQFFHFSPQTTTIDPAKYDRQFVGWFHDVAKSARNEPSTSFDAVYAGYSSYGELTPKPRPLAEWIDGPEMTIFGTSDDRRQFRGLASDDERRSYIETWWSRHPNRAEIEHRIAFADHIWPTEKMRGSLTDRGRVFVLLGPPRVIKQKPLSAAEGGATPGPQRSQAATQNVVAHGDGLGARQAEYLDRNEAAAAREMTPLTAKGTVERWVFSRDQIPMSVPESEVVFKFITQEGYGDHVLQRDFFTNKVLHDAAQGD
jgi:GWxTD domain-containing protein